MRVAELEGVFDTAQESLSDLVAVQEAYDVDGWRVSSPKTAKFRHICLHLMDTTAKFAKIAERSDHREDEGDPMSDDELRELLEDRGLLVAELAFSMLQIASLGDVNVSAALHDLYRRNARHFAPDSVFAELEPRRYQEILHR